MKSTQSNKYGMDVVREQPVVPEMVKLVMPIDAARALREFLNKADTSKNLTVEEIWDILDDVV